MIKFNLKNRKNRKGALSLEMMGIIAIIAVLVMSGLYYLNIMMRDTKVNDVVAAMQLIHTKAAEMYNNEASYEGLNDKIFINSGNAPSSMVSADRTKLKSPWGNVTLSSNGNDSNESFTLKFENVPGDVCQRLGSVMRNSTAWQSLKVGSGTYNLSDAGVGTKKATSLVTFLSNNCVNNNGTPVTLEFTSRKQ